MKRVGLIGESQNDTLAIKHLLQSKHKAHYLPLVPRAKGDQLKSQKYIRQIEFELKTGKYDLCLYTRDLDSERNRESRAKEFGAFHGLPVTVFFLLHVYQIEALILADVAAFNSYYKVDLRFAGNPMKVLDPKEKLKQATSSSKKPYEESHCPEIFKKLDFDKLRLNCQYFEEFAHKFEEFLSR